MREGVVQGRSRSIRGMARTPILEKEEKGQKKANY